MSINMYISGEMKVRRISKFLLFLAFVDHPLTCRMGEEDCNELKKLLPCGEKRRLIKMKKSHFFGFPEIAEKITNGWVVHNKQKIW